MNPAILPFIFEHIGVPVDQLTPDRKLSDLVVNSLDMIELVFALEENFGVDIPFDANMKFETVGELMEAMNVRQVPA